MNYNLSTKEVLLFFCKVLNPFKTAIFIMCSVAVLWAVDLSLRPYLLKIIIDKTSQNLNQNIFEYITFPLISYLLLTSLYSTLFLFYEYFIEIKTIPPLRRSVSTTSFDSLLQQSYSYYQNNLAGSLANKVMDLSNNIPEIVQIVIDRFFSHSLALTIAIFTLWQVNFVFALGVFIWSTVFIICQLLCSKYLTKLTDRSAEATSIVTGKIVDSLSNILSVRLFARNREEHNLLSLAWNDTVLAEQKLQWVYFWIWLCYGYLFVIVQGLSLYFLLKGRQSGWITLGDFVIVLSINLSIVDFLWRFTQDFSQFMKLWGRVTQALSTIQVPPEIQDKPDAGLLRVNQGQIIFDSVGFHYKNNKTFFRNKSIKIEGGQKVGLVGYSGSGKSTFVNLILRIYDVTAGQILIDGQNISECTQDSLHGSISMIPQDPLLFHRTLRENIRYGCITATDNDVVKAALQAHAHEFIGKLPQGYDSLVGERGVKLSGGQRQRIAIARAILKNAPILILDEATSQLDSLTERDIQDSLWKLIQGKTTIVIAHRLSTILHMDRILIFDQGKIVQDGTHQELLIKAGLYKAMWDAQIDGFLPYNERRIFKNK